MYKCTFSKSKLFGIYKLISVPEPLIIDRNSWLTTTMPVCRLDFVQRPTSLSVTADPNISCPYHWTKYQYKFPLPLCMPPIATTDNPHLPFLSCLILLLSPHLGRHILLNLMPCLKGHQVSFHRSTTLCAIPDVIFTVVPSTLPNSKGSLISLLTMSPCGLLRSSLSACLFFHLSTLVSIPP